MPKVELVTRYYVISSDDEKYKIRCSVTFDKEFNVTAYNDSTNDGNFCFKRSSAKTIKAIAELLNEAAKLKEST